MLIPWRNTGLKLAGSDSLLYALLLLLCALISYFGHASLAGLVFLPAALAVEIRGRYRHENAMHTECFSRS
jgi:hypothetical protein